MKLKKNFIVHEVAGETVAVPLEGSFCGVVKANETSAFIISCLREETDIEEIASKMAEEYEVSPDKAKKDIERIIAQLNEIGAIE